MNTTQSHSVILPSFPAAYTWLIQNARFSKPGESQRHSLLILVRGAKTAKRHTFGIRDGGECGVDVWHISEE